MNSLRASKKRHYVSATRTNWSMMFGETVAVYCERIVVQLGGRVDFMPSYLESCDWPYAIGVHSA
jgi:hypothetical protein